MRSEFDFVVFESVDLPVPGQLLSLSVQRVCRSAAGASEASAPVCLQRLVRLLQLKIATGTVLDRAPKAASHQESNSGDPGSEVIPSAGSLPYSLALGPRNLLDRPDHSHRHP